jgi:hypothetical protein
MISVIDWLFGSTLEINTDTFWMTRVALKSMDYRHQHSFFFPSPFFCFTRCICLVTELNKMFISQISRAWCAYVSVTFAPFQVSCHALQLRQCSVSSRKSVTPRSSIPPTSSQHEIRAQTGVISLISSRVALSYERIDSNRPTRETRYIADDRLRGGAISGSVHPTACWVAIPGSYQSKLSSPLVSFLTFFLLLWSMDRRAQVCRWSILAVRARRHNSKQPFGFQQWNTGYIQDKKQESIATFISWTAGSCWWSLIQR